MQTYHQYYAGDSDAREYQFKIVLFTVIIYAVFFAYATGWLNVWWMAALVSVSVTRWMIAFHELFHLRKPEKLNYFIRLQVIPFTPMALGYREFRDIHMGHHKYTATEQDPDGFHILGGPVKALFGAFTQNEQAVIRYIAAKGISTELAIMLLVRCAIFISLLAVAPMAFLIWWLVLRISAAVNDFVFFHLVHYRSGVHGTFPLPLPKLLAGLASILYGDDVVNATMHHDVHHQHNLIAPKYLPIVAKDIS